MAKEISSVARTGEYNPRSTKETIKLFFVEINVDNVCSSGEESTSSSFSSNSKGRRWSKDAQRAFLIGLDKLGKENWTAIAKQFVPIRTPTQVASHAQKYFERQKEERAPKRNKSSVFDINLEKESSNTCTELVVVVPLKENNNKGKQALGPISAMSIKYRLPPSYAYAYVPMSNYQFNFITSSTNATPVHQVASQSSSTSVDNLDLTL